MSDAETGRTFTLEEANQRLPLVRAIVQDIVNLYRDVSERRDRLATMRTRHGEAASGESLYSEENAQIEDELRSDEERLRNYIEELQELGVEFKDPVKGLVDFPSRVDGRIVHLCWMHGEPEIRFWHELEEGFAGRQPVLVESFASGETRDSDA